MGARLVERVDLAHFFPWAFCGFTCKTTSPLEPLGSGPQRLSSAPAAAGWSGLCPAPLPGPSVSCLPCRRRCHSPSPGVHGTTSRPSPTVSAGRRLSGLNLVIALGISITNNHIDPCVQMASRGQGPGRGPGLFPGSWGRVCACLRGRVRGVTPAQQPQPGIVTDVSISRGSSAHRPPALTHIVDVCSGNPALDPVVGEPAVGFARRSAP